MLPFFIESAKKMFDEVVLVSSPPDGTHHCKKSIAIAKKHGYGVILDTISGGFGALRTRCIGYSSCDWVMILDADEKISDTPSTITSYGGGKFPDTMEPGVRLSFYKDSFDPRQLLRDVVQEAENAGVLAICMRRRHWMSEPRKKLVAAQCWDQHPDPQLRLVKNTPFLCYDPSVKMHERLIKTDGSEPPFLRVDDRRGPMIEHFSIWAKAQEPEQNTEDAATYETLAPGCVKDMWLHHFPKQ